jgi:hypothetical protein
MNSAFKNSKPNNSAVSENKQVTHLNLRFVGDERPIENEDNLYSMISDRSEHFVQTTLKGMMANGPHNQE